MTHNDASVRRARRQRPIHTRGYLVTWDVDSMDRRRCARANRFLFGQTLRRGGKEYRYPGFVERPGVRYLGQSVLFATPPRAAELNRTLWACRVDHHTTAATLALEQGSGASDE
jgi:hypothetical protein